MEFHSDVIMEILTRFPMRFLGKTRLLSKEFNEKTYQSYYKKLQLQQTEIKSGFLLQSLRSNKHIFSFVSTDQSHEKVEFSLKFLPGYDPHILAVASHGLILCETQNPSRHRVPIYTISKPLTKQWIQIPNPKTRYFSTHIAMTVLSPNPLHFKIVRISDPECLGDPYSKFTRYICEVFDSKTWRWKQMKDLILPLRTLFLHHPPVSASGAIHWRLSNDTIFGFRLDEEEWSIFELPEPLRMNGDTYRECDVRVAEYEGKVSLMRKMEESEIGSLEIWVMEKYGSKIWNKRFIITNEAFKKETRYMPIEFYGSDIVVMWEGERLIYYNRKLKNRTRSEGQWNLDHTFVFPFWSDFEPCNFGSKSHHNQGQISNKKKKNKRIEITEIQEGNSSSILL